MKTLEDVMNEWSKDAEIDATEPGRALLDIPRLHAKYLNMLTTWSVISKKHQVKLAEHKKLMFQYYNGLLDKEDLEKYKLEPMSAKILKQDHGIYTDADETQTTLLMKKANADAIVDYCDRVLKELNSRTYQLRSYIDWERFVSSK